VATKGVGCTSTGANEGVVATKIIGGASR
jgi:hypothetical protein